MDIELSNSLSQAFDILTASMLRSLDFGDEVNLNDDYSIYSYTEIEYYTIRERATDDEVWVVQFGLGDDLVFTKI